MPVITGEVLLGRSPVYSIPIFFLKKKIKLGIEGDLTSYLYDVLPLGPPLKKEKKRKLCGPEGHLDKKLMPGHQEKKGMRQWPGYE